VNAYVAVLRRSLASGAAAILFALGPLGAGLAIANEHANATSSSAAGATLSKERYVDRVDVICADASAQVNDVLDQMYPGAPYSKLPPGDRDAWVVRHVAPIFQAEIAAAREVPAPQGDEATVGAIYDAMDRALATVERDPAEFRLFGQGTPDDPFATPAQLAGDYGLAVCALGYPGVE
jgi:hypothetical protein